MILLPVLNIGGMQMLRNADFNTLGKIMPQAKSIASSIGLVYLALTIACALGYLWAGMDGFDAITHASPPSPPAAWATTTRSFADLHARRRSGSPPSSCCSAPCPSAASCSSPAASRGRSSRDSQIRAFLVIYLCLAAGLVVARLLAGAPLDETTLREVLFNLASVITTTGFVSTDYSLWGPLAEMIFFCAMMICGCSGSTAGGPKVFRYQLLLGAVHGEVRRLHSPSAVFTPHFQGVAVTTDVHGLGHRLLHALLPHPRPRRGGARPARARPGQRHLRRRRLPLQRRPRPRPGARPGRQPSRPLNDPAKWVCSFLMLVGRLEIMTAYVLFTAAFWRGLTDPARRSGEADGGAY